MSASSNPTNYNLHARPLWGSIDVLKLPPTPQAHGGLSAGAMRRMRKYVEVHLGESIDLSMLAGVAGLSVHHFAGQFKQSAGATPHLYLMKKGVERAEEMFVQTGLSLVDAVGFSTKVIQRAISALCPVLRLESFGGHNASNK